MLRRLEMDRRQREIFERKKKSKMVIQLMFGSAIEWDK